jgi:hypothetical protein
MVDIGFKNSSNSDRNEGPPPPPDWNLVVVDFPPPPPSFDVPVEFPMCFESTFTLLAIKVSKDGSWSVEYPENKPKTKTGKYVVDIMKEAGVEISVYSAHDLWMTLLINLRRAAQKGLSSDLCHIIKKCICVEDWAEVVLLQGYYEREIRRKKLETGWSKLLGGLGAAQLDEDWWLYLDYTLEPVCKDCPDSKTCPCVGSKQIDLTDKIKSGPPDPPTGPPHTSIYTDSGGHEHSIPHGGGDESFKEVLKKILEIEDELFDCTK